MPRTSNTKNYSRLTEPEPEPEPEPEYDYLGKFNEFKKDIHTLIYGKGSLNKRHRKMMLTYHTDKDDKIGPLVAKIINDIKDKLESGEDKESIKSDLNDELDAAEIEIKKLVQPPALNKYDIIKIGDVYYKITEILKDLGIIYLKNLIDDSQGLLEQSTNNLTKQIESGIAKIMEPSEELDVTISILKREMELDATYQDSPCTRCVESIGTRSFERETRRRDPVTRLLSCIGIGTVRGCGRCMDECSRSQIEMDKEELRKREYGAIKKKSRSDRKSKKRNKTRNKKKTKRKYKKHNTKKRMTTKRRRR